MHVARVSASLRHGITIESSIASVEVGMRGGPVVRGAASPSYRMGAMNLGLVVSTLGRTEPLERLLRSLAPQVGPDDRIVLVAQDNRDQVERLAARFRGADVAIDVTTSERGASRGRNAGVAALPPASGSCTSPTTRRGSPTGASRPFGQRRARSRPAP